MKKLLKFLDDNLLRFGVAFAILFTALYPKLPSVHVDRTWVYIRLEDFVILTLAIIWFVQLLRRKVSLPRPEGYAIVLYWIAGLASLIYCLLFIAPNLVNFFPTVAGLQYARRIEYMILFFIAFATVRHVKDVYFYLITLCVTVLGVVIYGFGQRFYTILWAMFPNFFEKYPFCFPAFLTGNEEFAKGIPLCLTETSRVSSTFGGHYDLSAYMVFVIPILVALFFAVKRFKHKALLFILAILALDVLNFTSSRTSFGAYVVGITSMLVFWNRKRWIIPVLIISIGAMSISSDATIKRFGKTIQQVQVVSTEEALPSDLKEIIAKTKEAEEIKASEVPPASDFMVGDKSTIATPSSGFSTVLTDAQLKRLTMDEVAISSISGTFLIKKAYALDISFTTRFQAEWPRNWNAFLFSPVFGTGYSTLTLATDNDYLRALGETGLVGLLSFLFIFVILGIFLKNSVPLVKDPIIKALLFGLSGGVVGLLINAILIDVFEASKVAEPLWMLLGIGVGGAYLYKKETFNYKQELFQFFTSRVMVLIYLLVIILTAYAGSIGNFFVADDFTWLKWAATTELKDIPGYFINADNFFYRPFDKTVVYFLYQLFSFQPQGYHLFTLLMHFITVLGVYYLSQKLFKKRFLSFVTAVLFALHPVHHENLFWFSTISVTMGSMFIVYVVLAFIKFRNGKHPMLSYTTAFILSILAFLTYEIAVIIPLLLIVVDLFITRPKLKKNLMLHYLPFVLLVPAYFAMRAISNAFSGGGDYSYNLLNLPFNFVGNYIGYLLVFFGGNTAFPLYDSLRSGLREDALLAASILLILMVIVGIILYTFRRKLIHVFKHNEIVLVCFGLVFAAVSLLPFLGLGNIAPRYLYLASVGFVIMFVAALNFIAVVLMHMKQKYITIGLIIIVTIMSFVYYQENQHMGKKWAKVSSITKETLAYFRLEHESFSNSTNLYFVGAPYMYDSVWLFPVGLNDALWFIYRDRLPQVHHVGTIEDARAQISAQKTDQNVIFIFDDQGRIMKGQ